VGLAEYTILPPSMW